VYFAAFLRELVRSTRIEMPEKSIVPDKSHNRKLGYQYLTLPIAAGTQVASEDFK